MATIKRIKDAFTRNWIIENSLKIIPRYDKGVLTLRALYYQLVSIGMTNSIPHYKRVIGAMTKARRKNMVDYDVFVDHDRKPIGKTENATVTIENELDYAKGRIDELLNEFHRNRWEKQPRFVEIWIEKKALQGVFQPVCSNLGVALCACKGYPSLTFLDQAAERFKAAINNGQEPVILYFGDYDATGLDIDRKIKESLKDDFGVTMKVKRISLTKDQVKAWKLPAAPSKPSDSRTKNFKANGGIGQVELDAVEPNKLQKMTRDAINAEFDFDIYDKLIEVEKRQRKQYVRLIKKHLKEIA